MIGAGRSTLHARCSMPSGLCINAFDAEEAASSIIRKNDYSVDTVDGIAIGIGGTF